MRDGLPRLHCQWQWQQWCDIADRGHPREATLVSYRIRQGLVILLLRLKLLPLEVSRLVLCLDLTTATSGWLAFPLFV